MQKLLRKQQWMPIAFLALAVILFSVYVLFPIVQSVWLSFYQWDGLGEKTFVGFGNYIELFQDGQFWTAFVNNIYWLIFFMLAPPIGLLLALFLNQKMMGIRFVKAMFFFPFVISQVVVGLVFSWFYDPSFGLFNKFIELFGFQPIAVLSDPNVVTFGIIAAGLWPQIAYCMILYLTGLNNLSPDQIFSSEQFDQCMSVNLKPHFFTAQVVAPAMAEAGGGSIINMSSNSWMLGLSGYPGYVTAKAGVSGLTKGLARELGGQKIRVNTVLPGWVMTEKQKRLWLTPEAEAELMVQQALKETIEPEDVADLVLFLGSDNSRMISGQSLAVDGGRL